MATSLGAYAHAFEHAVRPYQPTALDAADAMLVLNRRVKQPDAANYYIVYRIKTRLIRALYLQGYGIGVEAGLNYEDGTVLYNFAFAIGGVCYQWHQPADQVDFPFTLKPITPGTKWGPSRSRAHMTDHELLNAVRGFLRFVGG